MKTTWWRAIATPVLWLSIAGLLWALGAWLLLATMNGVGDDMLPEVVVHVALVVALVAGIALSRRTPTGYLVLALAAVACAVLRSPWRRAVVLSGVRTVTTRLPRLPSSR